MNLTRPQSGVFRFLNAKRTTRAYCLMIRPDTVRAANATTDIATTRSRSWCRLSAAGG
jgi:hypothetical protein